MLNKTTLIQRERRTCECCGSQTHESLWKYDRTVKSRTQKWHFKVNNVICPNCGFVFVGPVYKQESLAEYYADSTTYFRIDYNVDKRVNLLARYSCTDGNYFEFGAKDKTVFHDKLEAHFGNVITHELGSESTADVSEAESILHNSMDVVSHYFVLEHVPNVKEFLQNCWNMLRLGGHMVVEVPDIALYPKEIAALMLFEHTNHFSIGILERIANQVGFELVEWNREEASRPFGFVAVFKKMEAPVLHPLPVNEYFQNKQYFNTGLFKAKRFFSAVDEAYHSMNKWIAAGKKVVLWGANANFDLMFSHRKLPNAVTIIDSDPSKKDFVENRIVLTPDQAEESIRHADALITFTGQWNLEILKNLKENYGKVFHPNYRRVVCYYFGDAAITLPVEVKQDVTGSATSVD